MSASVSAKVEGVAGVLLSVDIFGMSFLDVCCVDDALRLNLSDDLGR